MLLHIFFTAPIATEVACRIIMSMSNRPTWSCIKLNYVVLHVYIVRTRTYVNISIIISTIDSIIVFEKIILRTLTLDITPFDSPSHGTCFDVFFNLVFAQTMSCVVWADNLVIRWEILQENFTFI